MEQLKTRVTFDPFTLEDNGTDCITLDGFSAAVHRVLNAAWGNNWGVYSEEGPTGNDPEEQIAPHITFELLKRTIADEFKAFRGKVMDVKPDPDNPGYHLIIKRRIFKCEVAWSCFHKTNRMSRLMASKLEYLLENYVGYFKEHGLHQMKFKEEKKREVDISSRQKLCKTTLVYDLWIMETVVERTRMLRDLQIGAEVIHPTPLTP